MRSVFLSFICFFFANSVIANELSQDEKADNMIQWGISEGTGDISNFVRLPMEELMVIENGGQLFFVSGDGRFLIKGQLTDIYLKKTLDTIDEIQFASESVPIRAMAKIERLNRFTVGTGPKEVIAFVDPRCPGCKQLVSLAEKHADKATTHFVVVPGLGEESHKLAFNFYCAESKGSAARRFATGNFTQYPDAPANCKREDYDYTLVLAQLLKIQRLPYLIAPSTRVAIGVPKDYAKFLEL